MSFLKTTAIQHLNASTPAINLTANGDVGIGITNPTFDSGTGLEIQRADVSTVRIDSVNNSTALELKAAVGAVAVSGRGNYPLLMETNGIERMRIDSSGRVTMPYQPMCWLTHNSIVSYTQNALIQWTSSYDPLSMFSGAPNYRVTVPVAGRYRITVDLLINSGSTSPMAIYVRQNGSLVRRFYTTNDGYQTSSISIILNCSANDYIDTISYETGTTSIWGGDIGNFTVELIG